MTDVEMTDVEDGPHPLQLRFEEAEAKRDKAALQVIFTEESTGADPREVKAKELAVFALGKLFLEEKDIPKLKQLLTDVRPFFQIIAKARTARIVRRLFDLVSSSGMSLEDQVNLVENFIAWSKAEKRSYLRQRLQTRLGELKFQLGKYTEALQVVSTLAREVRKMDDKGMLVDVHVLESRLYYSLKNHSKAKAGLVAARTAAHSIYVAPLTQAEIDHQSGVISAEEKEFKVGFSYFYEAFEGYHNSGEHHKEAEACLKYMLMCKILDGSISDIGQVMQQKNVLKYKDLDTVVAMREIADTYLSRDLHMFNEVRKRHVKILENDKIATTHLNDLYNKLLEQHLLRVVEPYERVEVSHIARHINLDAKVIESKLSQMILDDKLKGILDQSDHCLILYPDDTSDSLYPDAMETLEGLHKVIDALFDKCAGKFLPKKEEKKDDKKDDKDKEKDKDAKEGAEADKKKDESK